MALYTICATTRDRAARPCAVIQAVSDEAAASAAGDLRGEGVLAFLPQEAQLTVRPASRREINAYLAFMPVQPLKGPAGRDHEISRRARRSRLAFFEKLWRGEVLQTAHRKSAD